MIRRASAFDTNTTFFTSGLAVAIRATSFICAVVASLAQVSFVQ